MRLLSHSGLEYISLGYPQCKVKGFFMSAILSLSPSVNSIIDECGAIDSEIKRLTKQKEALAAQIKSEGAGRYTGSFYEGLVYTSEGRVSIDWEAIALKLAPSRQLIAAHTKQAASVTSLKLSKV
jgi:hypothetical protein